MNIKTLVIVGCLVLVGACSHTTPSTPKARSTRSAASPCGSPSPGEGWVCQDGGWLPPGHPNIRKEDGTLPTPHSRNPFRAAITDPPRGFLDSNGTLTQAEAYESARTGTALPASYLYFTPPLILRDVAELRGSAGRTILIPNTTAAGPLVIVETSVSGGLLRVLVKDLMIECRSREQTGLIINSHRITIERVAIFGCDEGINIAGTVDSVVRDSYLGSNTTGIFVMGYGPSGIWGANSVTTLRFSGLRITSNTTGVRIGHGLGIVLDDSTILESNGTGLLIEPAFPGAAIDVLLRDVWFEANGTDIRDSIGVVRSEGITRRR